MEENNKKITIVVPMYNEEKVVEECYKKLKINLEKIEKYDYEIIFINDGSRDKTLEILESKAQSDKKIKIISFSRNFGHQSAVSAGLQNVTGDVVIIIDADLQDPPELIPDMLKLWEQGNDIVYGKRIKREGENLFKLFSAKMFYKVLKSLSDVDIPADTGDFRLIDRKVVDIVNTFPEHNKFFRGLFSWVGYKQIPYEYERKERFAGKTKYPLRKMLKLASDGIISFSTKPLRLVGVFGLISILVSILLCIYAIISYIYRLNNLSAGWTSIMVAITFFSGIQMMISWMISEYIGRIYDETKGRPQYIIEKKINFNK